jgi:hypothetical protein
MARPYSPSPFTMPPSSVLLPCRKYDALGGVIGASDLARLQTPDAALELGVAA